jgi:hypothetical protein
MNKNWILALSCGLALSNAQAQIGKIGDRVIKRTEQNVERRVEQNINRKVDKTVDDALNGRSNKKTSTTTTQPKTTPSSSSTTTSQPSSSNTDGNSGGKFNKGSTSSLANDGVVEESPFIGSFVLEVETSETGKFAAKPQRSRLSYYLKAYDMATVITDLSSNQTQRFILRRQDNKMILVDDAKRSATVTRMTNIGAGKGQEEATKVTRTNETKMIEGVPCVKYIVETKSETSEIWSNEGGNLRPFAAAAMAMGAGQQGQNYKQFEHPNFKGCPMEIISTPKNNANKKTKILVKNLQMGTPDETFFHYNGYQITDMSQY